MHVPSAERFGGFNDRRFTANKRTLGTYDDQKIVINDSRETYKRRRRVTFDMINIKDNVSMSRNYLFLLLSIIIFEKGLKY